MTSASLAAMLAALMFAPNASGAERQWTGQIGAAYVWQSASGQEDSFFSQYGLDEGFQLEVLDLDYRGDSALERFTAKAYGFGGAFPTESARFGFTFRGGVDLRLDYDRRESFFQSYSDTFDLPADDWDITRWHAAVDVNSWKSIDLSFSFRHHERDGQVFRPLFGMTTFYGSGTSLDETMSEASFRIATKTLPVQIEFEQSFARYERNNRRFPVGSDPLTGTSTNLLDDTSTLFEDTQDVPTSRLTLSYVKPKFEGLVTLLYADTDVESGGTGEDRFAIGGGSIGTIAWIDEVVGSARNDALFGAVNLGFLLSPEWVLRVTGDVRDSSTDADLLGQRLVRGNSPLGSPVEFGVPVDETSRYEVEDSSAQVRIEFRKPGWSLWGGALTASRDVSWRRTSDDPLTETSRDTDGAVVGWAWTPDGPVELNVEYERGDFTRTVFRTDPQTVDRATLKIRSRLADGWRVTAHAAYEEASNEPETADLDYRARPFGIAANWISEDGTTGVGLDLQRTEFSTETGLILPTGDLAQSVYDLDMYSTTIHGHTLFGKFGFRGSATHADDNGDTWPFESWNAMARLSYEGSRSLTYAAFVDYWSYRENLSSLENYYVTRIGASLTWRLR